MSESIPGRMAVRLDALRRAAEARLRRSGASAHDLEEVEHELLVHQAELEIQNEELRSTQLELEHSRRQYFSLYDLAPVGYLLLDEKGVIRNVNLTAADLLGADRARLKGRPLSAYVRDGGTARLFGHLAEVKRTKCPASCELRVGSSDRNFWVRLSSDIAPPSSHPQPREGEPGAELFTTLTDITDRVEASRALEDRERRLRAILDHAPLAITLVDHHGTILEWNEGFERLLGPRSGQIAGMPLRRFLDPDSRRRLGDALRQEEIGRARTLEVELDPAGWARMTISPIPISPTPERDAEALYRLVLIEDITEGKRAKEREADLESQLDRAHHEKLRALGQLAGGVAHDFNNMLAAILALAESASLAPELPESLQEEVRGIREASLRARELVRQILTFARRGEPERRVTRLVETVDAAMALVRGAAPSSIDVRVERRLDPRVLADPSQLEQVIVNFATNAIQAMDGREGVLEVVVDGCVVPDAASETAVELAGGHYARVTVSDTGPGVSEAALPHLFEPFFTTRGEAGGCGMGLATSLGIAQLHGGAIEVRNRADGGAQFVFYLPALDAVATRVPAPEAAPSRWSGRVLIVDDEALVLQSADRLLRRLGADVVLCGGPDEALRRIREDPLGFDVLITDLSMPGRNGLVLARDVAGLDPELPIFVLTGNRSRINPEELRAAGIRGVLDKPLSARELSQALAPFGTRDRGDRTAVTPASR